MTYFRKIGITFFSKLLISLLNLLVLVITARWLGAGVRGQIGLLVFFLAGGVIVAELIAGPVLVYWTSRVKNNLLIRYAYLWALMVSLLMVIPVLLFDPVPGLNPFSIFLLLFFLSANGANSQLLLGRERILYYNLASLAAPVYLFSICYFLSGKEDFAFQDYVFHLGVSYFLSWLISMIGLFTTRNYHPPFLQEAVGIWKIAKSGFFNQSSSLFTLAGSRLNLFFLEAASGIAAVGVFSSALSFAEAILIVPGSISLVMVSTLVNRKEEEQNKRTIALQAFISAAITLFFMLVLWMVPTIWFEQLLGRDFSNMNELFLPLLPGIVCVGAGSVFTHYFSGNGKYSINAGISFVGLLVWLLSSYFLTGGSNPQTGAAFSFSCGWIFVLLLNVLVFYWSGKKTSLK